MLVNPESEKTTAALVKAYAGPSILPAHLRAFDTVPFHGMVSLHSNEKEEKGIKRVVVEGGKWYMQIAVVLKIQMESGQGE